MPFLRAADTARVFNHTLNAIVVDDTELASVNFHPATGHRASNDEITFFAPRP
jgi:hypothetical protein